MVVWHANRALEGETEIHVDHHAVLLELTAHACVWRHGRDCRSGGEGTLHSRRKWGGRLRLELR
jgi:hypothetical protein